MGEKTGANPTDRGKRGVKRSLLTEASGIPVGLAVDGANRHDMKLVWATVDSVAVSRPAPSPEHPQGMCLDKGYDFAEVRRTLDEFGFTAHIRSRGESPDNYRGSRPIPIKRDRLPVEGLGPVSKPGVGWWNAPIVG